MSRRGCTVVATGAGFAGDDAPQIERLAAVDVEVVPAPAAALEVLEDPGSEVDGVVYHGSDAAALDDVIAAARDREPPVPVQVLPAGDLSAVDAFEAGATDVAIDPAGESWLDRFAARIDATPRRSSPTVEPVLRSLVDGDELVALFDADHRHRIAVGDRLADALGPTVLRSTPVSEAFAGMPRVAALLDANYAAALAGDRQCRELAIGERTYQIETMPVPDDGVEAGVVRFTPTATGRVSAADAEDARIKLHQLHDIASELEAADSETEIYELAIDCANRVLAFDACAIAELEGDVITVRAATAPELDVEVTNADAGEGIAGKTIDTGQSYLVEDVAAEEDARVTNEQYRSALSIPIGETGVLQAISTEVGYYTEQDRTLAELLVAHVENALERVRFQEALALERDHFAALFENVPDAAVQYTIDDGVPRIESVNAAFARLFGYEATEAIGESTLDLFVPAGEREAAADLYDAIAAGDRVDAEVRRRAADGIRPFLLRSVPLTAGDGPRQGYLIYTDLSELKERERKLVEQNERLDRFASVVSHDLRNPLNVASAYVKEAKETGDLSLLDEVERSHERTFAIIEDVLTLARDEGSITETTDVSLASTAEDAWANVDTAGATIEIEADATIEADLSRLRQLLENCFRNAVEHGSTSPRRAGEDAVEHGASSDRSGTRSDGDAGEASDPNPAGEHGGVDLTVTVGVTDDGFYVADDGTGLPDTDTEQLFEYGYTTSPAGTGFGLAIVENIADGHGWDVTATDSEWGGAKFVFTAVTSRDD